MTGLNMARALEQMPFALAIAKSTWLFPSIEALHVLAFTMVVGTVGMMDMRLLGVGSMQRAVTELIRSVLPWTWSAFAVAAICGALLFSSRASTYYVNIPFRIKVACLVLAGCNMLAFYSWSRGDMCSWDTGRPPLRARVAGAISLALWLGIVTSGRWIGFTT